MENTARKLSSEQVVKEFTQAHGNLDLLRIYLIAGSADISRSYELVAKWAKNATSDADKANFNNALKILQNIELKRIMLTEVIYGANDVQLPANVSEVSNENETIIEEEKPTIMMLPSLNDVLARVRIILSENTDVVASSKEAFELLKTTVGQGKVLNAEGKPETWDNEAINTYLTEATNVVEDIKEETQAEVKEGEKFGAKTIDTFILNLIENGKNADEVKSALKTTLLGKVISSDEADYLIKDEATFEDYYTRMLSTLVSSMIEEGKTPAPVVVNKQEVVATAIEEEVKPFLEKLDKDATEVSLTPVTRKIRDVYQTNGFKMSLKDAFLKARELAETLAPNLLKRNKETAKNNVPIVVSEKEAPVEIFDESHNIQETNKPLWAEVEKYEYLTQLFEKATELYKLGNWRDALSMSIILISSGKIKETEASTEGLKWDVDQIKLWYYNIVEASASGANETATKVVDVQAEVITDKKVDEIAIEKDSKTTAESSESSSKHEEKVEEVKQGPVPQVGSIDSKENLSRLLKDNSPWKDTYKFKSFLVKTDHHRGGAMSFEIVDATNDQVKDLLITESNMTAFFDGLTAKLVETRNAQPEVKKTIMETLSKFYEISNSEAKRIAGALVNDADAIRKANKASKKEETTEETTPAEVVTPEIVVPETIVPETVIPNVEPVPLAGPVVEKESVELPKPSESSSETTPTETTAGEPSTNSNNQSYEGFEDIMKAKNKIDLHKAIYAKATEYPVLDDGVKAVFTVIDAGRRDGHYKKSQIRNWKPTPAADLLSAIQRIVIAGAEAAKAQ